MIEGLKPYPVMRDSGQRWLGQVPEHWQVAANRSLFTEVKDRDCPAEEMLSVTIRKGVVRQTSLLEESAKKDGSNLDRSAYKLVQPGDIAYNKMRAWQGAIGASSFRGIVSPAYVVMRPHTSSSAAYFHELFRTPMFAKEAERWSYGIASDMWSLRPEHFKVMYSVVPPTDEQAAVVRFLHHADAKIRRYIAAKQKLIKLLEEEKQAIIHRAVTRGLDPNVKLKPSGVEWLGNVPEHWEIKKLHQITDADRPIMYGIVLPGPNVDDGVFIVKGGNCEPGKLRPERLSKTTFAIEARYARSRLIGGDIVIAIRGGVGSSEIVPPELAGANLTQDAARIATVKGINQRWLLQAVRSPIFQEHVKSRMVGATVRGINIRDLKRIELAVPPADEQARIADLIAVETANIAAAIERATAETALLREYRTRLIADVVTGKLDVREAAAKLPDIEPEAQSLDEIEDLPQDEESAESTELEAEDAA